MFKKTLAIFVILTGITSNTLPALAISSTDFNPNFIISDAELQNYTSMTTTDVQTFLQKYNSALTNLTLPDKDYTLKKPAEIIMAAAQEHKINPKYLLVKLQKEQSLITAQNPTNNQLNGATGYGITDGCGWNCESYLNNQGFGKQVDSAAGIMRWYYDNKNTLSWIKKGGSTVSIDNMLITPANDATAFLYTYTPHIQGNQNFWKLWQNWFTAEQFIPEGSLVKSADNSTIYLIQNGQKRAFKGMSALASRYNPKMVITLPDTELENYGIGNEISLPNYSILKQDNNYYLLDYDIIRPFASFEVVKKLGYNPDEFIDITSSEISNYTLGSTINLDTSNPTGRLVKVKETGFIYYLKDGFYQRVYDEPMAKKVFPNLTIEKVAQTSLKDYQPGAFVKFNDGTLFGIKSNKAIFVMEKGKKRPITSEETFLGFDYDWKNVIWVDDLLASLHDTGDPVYLPASLAVVTSTKTTTKTNTIAKTTSVVKEEEPTGKKVIDTGDYKIVENGKMFTIPEKDTVYVGDKITTNVNTYLISDYVSGEILAGKNVDVVRPLASFTKVMTAYELMQNGLKLYAATAYSAKLQKSAHHDFRIAEGEQVSNENLIQALLVSSLNTPAKILASNITDTEAEFVALMNKQAEDWGLTKTKFTDTYGYDLGNLSTAREYLKIYTTAEKNSDIRRILGMKDYAYIEVKDLNSDSKHSDIHSNYLMGKTNLKFKIISSKTGYLDEAGSGVVMLIERPSDNKQFIVIIMGNPDYTNRFVEPEKIANYAITNF